MEQNQAPRTIVAELIVGLTTVYKVINTYLNTHSIPEPELRVGQSQTLNTAQMEYVRIFVKGRCELISRLPSNLFKRNPRRVA
jgi:hypothetical protein